MDAVRAAAPRRGDNNKQNNKKNYKNRHVKGREPYQGIYIGYDIDIW